ncbi:hypothetical protein [Rossellomorea sp. NS-SX7]
MGTFNQQFTFIYKTPENSTKTKEEIVHELIQTTIRKVVAK